MALSGDIERHVHFLNAKGTIVLTISNVVNHKGVDWKVEGGIRAESERPVCAAKDIVVASLRPDTDAPTVVTFIEVTVDVGDLERQVLRNCCEHI